MAMSTLTPTTDPVTGPPAKRTGPLTALLGAGRTYFLLAAAAALVAMVAAFALLSTITDRTQYWVLTADVPARTPITADLLEPVDALRDTAPPNALTPAQLADPTTGQRMVAKVALAAGDPLTPSVVGPPDRIDTGVPDGYVVGSFAVDARNAVAGKVRAGDRIDVIAVDDQRSAKVILHDVAVLDVTVDPAKIADAATDDTVGTVTPESGPVRAGIPQIYTVALPPADAARLAVAMDMPLMVVLAGNNPPPTLDVRVGVGEVFGDDPVRSSAPDTAATPTP